MCGISGAITFGAEDLSSSFRKGVEAMNWSQALRGPDDSGIFIRINPRVSSDPHQSAESAQSASIVFGHRRLSIIDLSKNGHQPMERGHIAITFNGEIYNFAELKKELEKSGAQFQTHSDTEVILAAYEAYGTDAFGKLRGMFAFALWDGEKKKLFLVRDRFGIKPLYYAKEQGRIVFASTVRAIKESGLVSLSRNDNAWLAFLLFGSVPLPLTTWNEIEAVPEGYFFEFNREEVKKTRYYNLLPFFANTHSVSSEYLAGVKNILHDSVSAHLVSDAPLGVFLSGGLDSSALAVLATRPASASTHINIDPHLNYPHKSAEISVDQRLQTLSVIFNEEEFSERKYQRLLAEKIGSNHREVLVTKEDFFAQIDDALGAMDQPMVDGINTYFIAKAAHDAGLKVVLSGLGGDELFLGYGNFRRARMLKMLSSVPFSRAFSMLGGKYAKFSFLQPGSVLGCYLVFRGIFPPAEAARIIGVSEKYVFDFLAGLEERLFGEERKMLLAMHPVQLLSYLETKLYMQNQLLKDSDVMAMHHSVEVRVPFVDHRLFEYVAPIPPEIKLNGYPHQSAFVGRRVRTNPHFNKQILVDAVKDMVPSAIYNRPKMGFTFPFQKWLRGSEEFSASGSHWSKIWAQFIEKKQNN